MGKERNRERRKVKNLLKMFDGIKWNAHYAKEQFNQNLIYSWAPPQWKQMREAKKKKKQRIPN